ncbi:MAG: pyridoxamine 5'-phosphate oxidase family protein [Acidimicrobiales bacterium]|jgi:hypothetical protein|nr:pyridoxamine 5'-phosphate oxidase family protein [Acidimicrobiales bacterium]MDP6901079.1 pyridoxamine 5'-phosphate oxidase family protein [Acidimicrobiales bacterium]HJL99035.1 pyridoxamine 5'-phosphate oxidase family protein [Acidimicrobiales bacterium]
MTESGGQLYGSGARALQDHFDARRLADRLNEVTVSAAIDDRTATYLERATYFFLATVDGDGFPDVSYKGGRPGFVKVLDDRTLRFPSYDGNGMYRSLGNIQETSNVALLFIRQNEKANRIRIHGTAAILLNEAALSDFEGAEAVVEVKLTRIFPNCPRYVHDLESGTISEFAPGGSVSPPEPEWKQWEIFADVLPER